MKLRWLVPLVILIFFSLACSFTKLVKEPTAAPIPPAAAQPTKAAEPTLAEPTNLPPAEPVEPTQAQPTATEEAAECPAAYTETFDEPSECWDFSSVFSVTEIGNSDLVTFGPKAGYMDIDVTTNEDLYLYFFNQTWDYPTVVVEAEVVNHKGANKNGVVLACYVNDQGWYEVRLETGGFYQIYQYDTALREQGKNPYVFLHEGGAKGIRIGYDRVNTMRWECVDKNLAFNLNGEEIWTTTLREVNPGGGVGIGLVTYKNNTPVHIGFESLTVSEP